MNVRRMLGGCAALLVASSPGSPRAELARDYYSLALQGDLRGAPALFASADSASLTEKELELERRFEARFVRRDEVAALPDATPFIQEVVHVYRDYWTRSMMGELDAARGESYLKHHIREVLAARGVAGPLPDDVVLDRLQEEIERDGLHVLGGVTLPYFDLMLWKTQESRTYECQLTDASQRVQVEFLSDFIVWGWSHYATFGRAYTGGWATPEKLFCLRDDYDLESEKFKVSYIQHEGRHFADYKIFPKLEQIDLEYRAKLTELAFAETSLHELIEVFAGAGALNAAAPHSYANFCVVRDLSTELFGEPVQNGKDPRWIGASPLAIHAQARALLEKNTAKLEAAGSATTAGVVRPQH